MARKKEQIIAARCIECDSRVRFRKDPNLGDRILCPECDAQLEVVALSPLELYWAQDDYDNYEDYNSDDNSGKYDYSYDDDYPEYERR